MGDQEKQMLQAIASVKASPKTMDISDSEMIKLIYGEIEGYLKSGNISKLVSDELKFLPSNKLILAYDAVQEIFKKPQNTQNN